MKDIGEYAFPKESWGMNCPQLDVAGLFCLAETMPKGFTQQGLL